VRACLSRACVTRNPRARPRVKSGTLSDTLGGVQDFLMNVPSSADLLPGRRARRSLAFGVLAFALGLPGIAAAGPGEEMYQEMREKGLLYPDQEWQDYINAIGQRLVKAGGAQGEYHFYLVDNSAVNAEALPDGYIFVMRGLVAYLRSEDELAAVVGHEIGHVVHGHTRSSKILAAMGGVAGFIGAILTGSGSVVDLTNTATGTLMSGEGRENELEADAYGGEVLAKAGYDPMAMIDTLQVLKDQGAFSRNVLRRPSVYHGLFSSHPKEDKRLYDAVSKAQSYQAGEYREPELDFLSMLDGLVFGDEASTGLIKDGAYYHNGFRIVIKFPEGWSVSNTAAEVIGRAPQGGQHSIISMQRMNSPSEEQTPEEYVTKTLKRDDVINGQSLTINGYPAFIGEVKVLSGNAQARRIAIIYKDGSVYLFRGEVGALGDVAAFEPQWRQTLESFRAMTAEDLQQADRQHIRVVMVEPDKTWAELAQQVSIKDFPEETLRLLNNQYPAGEPHAGDMIKLVQ
jgi:predicted Zn-dependent protease